VSCICTWRGERFLVFFRLVCCVCCDEFEVSRLQVAVEVGDGSFLFSGL